MSAIKRDTRTRASMAAGAPGEWKHKPLVIPAREVRPPRVVDPRFKADSSKKPASTGPKPGAPVLSADEMRERQARSGQANAGDVFGHNEREREALPNRSLTSNTTFRSQQKAPRRKPGFAAMGAVGVAGKHVPRKRKVEKAPKARKGYVYEVPERLAKYASK